MEKKKIRSEILYVRIKKENMAWLKTDMKRLGYTSKSEFIDKMIDQAASNQARKR